MVMGNLAHLTIVICCRLFLILIALFSLWLLQMPLSVDVCVAFAIAISAPFISLVNLSLLTTGIAISVAAVYSAFSLTAENFRQFYRDHEEFIRPGFIYQSNVAKTIRQPHGDLFAIDPSLPVDLREIRDVEFVTDSRGYRNRNEYAGEDQILLGDSFLVGNGITQSQTLPEVLRTTYGLPVYSLGHPQDPIDYERRAAWAISEFGADKIFSFFFYEGNDFLDPTKTDHDTVSVNQSYDEFRLKITRAIFGTSRAPTTLYKLIRRAHRAFIMTNSALTTVGYVNSVKVAHSIRDTKASFTDAPSILLDLLPHVWTRAACVFFIPTKARLYPESLPNSPQQLPQPAPAFLQLRELLEPFGVQVVDLTPALRNAKAHVEATDQLLFWKDDTHWNGAGVAAVAPVVAECLRASRLPSTRSVDLALQLKVKFQDEKFLFGEKVYNLASPTLAGFIESVSTNAHSAILSGWAGSKTAANDRTTILAIDGDHVISSTVGRAVRPDTAQILGDNSRTAGFDVAIPIQIYRRSRSQIRVIALSDDQALELSDISK
jgi:hypothetical protein